MWVLSDFFNHLFNYLFIKPDHVWKVLKLQGHGYNKALGFLFCGVSISVASGDDGRRQGNKQPCGWRYRSEFEDWKTTQDSHGNGSPFLPLFNFLSKVGAAS